MCSYYFYKSRFTCQQLVFSNKSTFSKAYREQQNQVLLSNPRVQKVSGPLQTETITADFLKHHLNELQERTAVKVISNKEIVPQGEDMEAFWSTGCKLDISTYLAILFHQKINFQVISGTGQQRN